MTEQHPRDKTSRIRRWMPWAWLAVAVVSICTSSDPAYTMGAIIMAYLTAR